MSSKQTSLDLNGPFIEFTTQPSNKFACPGDSFSINAVASVFFLDEPSGTPINPAVPTGTLSYQWYEVVGGSYVPVSDNSVISGSKTSTLTFSNISESYRGKQYIVGVDYVPSAYAQPQGSAVTVGTARSTGNAINEILYSNISTINVGSVITITQDTYPPVASVGINVNTTFSIRASASDNSALSYQWYANDVRLFDGSGVSGSGTNTLNFSYQYDGTVYLYCEVTNSTACLVPVRSGTAILTVVGSRNVVNIEYIPNGGDSSTRARLESVDLDNVTEYIFGPTNTGSGTDITSFYAPERDVAVEMDLYGSAGSGRGSYAGGAGGYSRIRLTLEKNVEYVIAPFRYDVLSETHAIFLYKKAKLIAAVGAGGGAGELGNGGAGGGIGKSGESGRLGSKLVASGGAVVSTGALPSTGISGSRSYEPDLCCGDTQADPGVGGRVLPCTRGDATSRALYSSCSDIGNSVQFRLANVSTPVSNTAFIQRGFKAGYALRNTAGSAGDAKAGSGGEGATGGDGGGIGFLINFGTQAFSFSEQGFNFNTPETTFYTTTNTSNTAGGSGNIVGCTFFEIYGYFSYNIKYPTLSTSATQSALTFRITIFEVANAGPPAYVGTSTIFRQFDISGKTSESFNFRVPVSSRNIYNFMIESIVGNTGSLSQRVTLSGQITVVGQVGAAPYGGGGGGSGYTDGSVTVVDSQTGIRVNNAAKAVIRIGTSTAPPPPAPPPAPTPPPTVNCRAEGEANLAYFIDVAAGGDPSGIVLGLTAVDGARSCGFTDVEIVNLANSQGKRFGSAAQKSLNCSTEFPSSCDPTCRAEGLKDLAYFIDVSAGGDPAGVVLGLTAVNAARSCGFSDCEIVSLATSQRKKFGTSAMASLNCSTESPSSCNPPGC